MVAAGDTFKIDPGELSSGTNLHLWVVAVVYRPELENEDHALIVSITSVKALADRTCVLGPDNADGHPFIHHASCVLYAKTQSIPVRTLVANGIPHAAVSVGVLDRIRQGFRTSSHTPRWVKPLLCW